MKKANILQIICVVGAFNPTLTDEILDAYTAMRYEAEKLGIKAVSAGCGVTDRSFAAPHLPLRLSPVI